MARLRSQDRKEIETYRDHIAQRVEELDDAVSFGVITDDDKHATLVREFGPDYQRTLVECNTILHAPPQHLDPHSHIVLMILVAFVLASATTLAFFVIPVSMATDVSGAAVTQYDSTFILKAGQTQRIPITTDITIDTLDATFTGRGPFTLILEDATAAHALAKGDDTYIDCMGCGHSYTPPYLIRLRSADGVLSVKDLTIQAR